MVDGNINIGINFEDKGAKKGIDNLKKGLKDADNQSKNLQKSFGGLGTVLGGVLGAAVIQRGLRALSDGLKSVTTDVGRLGDQIAKTSDKLGVGVQALQELRFAAERSGVSTQTFDVALQRLTRRAAEAADGTGVALSAFRKLGIQLRDTGGNIRRTEDIFQDLAKAFEGVEDQSEAVRLAFKLFDTEGVALVNVLKQGGEGLEALRDRARELGFILTEEAARASEKFVDAQTDLNLALQGVKNTIGIELLPAITNLLKSFTNLIVANKELIVSGFNLLVKVLRVATVAMGLFFTSLAVGKIFTFVTAVGGLRLALIELATAFKAATFSARVFRGVLTVGLAIVLDAIIVKIVETQNKVEGFSNVFKVIGIQSKIFANNLLINLQELRVKVLSFVVDLLTRIAALPGNLFGALGLDKLIIGLSAAVLGSVDVSIKELQKQNEGLKVELAALLKQEGEILKKQGERSAQNKKQTDEQIRIAQLRREILIAEQNRESQEIIKLKEEEIKFLQEIERQRGTDQEELARERFERFLEQRDEQRQILLEKQAEEREEDRILQEELDLLEEERKAEQRENEAEIDEQEALRKQAAERRVAQERAKIQTEANKKFLDAEIKHGIVIAQLDKILGSQRVQAAGRVFNELAQLTQSKNQTLKRIGQVAAIGQITISTAQAASELAKDIQVALPFPASIPVIAAAVGARIAFGAEQISNVLAAQAGGLVEGFGRGDRVPARLEPGELVVPRLNFEEVIDAVTANRGLVERDESPGERPMVNITIEGNLIGDEENIDRLINQINDRVEFRNATLRTA